MPTGRCGTVGWVRSAREVLDRLTAAVVDGGAIEPLRDRIPMGEKGAAVLVLFDTGNGDRAEDLALTFVEKSPHLRRHAGQFAFPGGRTEPEDADHVDTALREAHEEIGLDRDQVSVLAVLPTVSVPSGYDVTAVVAHSASTPQVHVGDVEEIAAIHRVPVSVLVDPQHRFTATYRPAADAVAGSGEDEHYAGPAFGIPAEGARAGVFIWGLTAHLLDTLLTLAGLAGPWDAQRTIPVPTQYR